MRVAWRYHPVRRPHPAATPPAGQRGKEDSPGLVPGPPGRPGVPGPAAGAGIPTFGDPGVSLPASTPTARGRRNPEPGWYLAEKTANPYPFTEARAPAPTPTSSCSAASRTGAPRSSDRDARPPRPSAGRRHRPPAAFVVAGYPGPRTRRILAPAGRTLRPTTRRAGPTQAGGVGADVTASSIGGRRQPSPRRLRRSDVEGAEPSPRADGGRLGSAMATSGGVAPRVEADGDYRPFRRDTQK
jgi:hypothetical protein